MRKKALSPSHIKQIRTKLGLNQRDFAMVLGLSGANAVSNIETGYRNTSRTVENLLSLLDHVTVKEAAELVNHLRQESDRRK